MSETERQRLQELVDAIHLTAAALRERGAAMGSARGGFVSPGGTWGPVLWPRGWSFHRLGTTTEAAMFLPYVTTIPSYYPVAPIGIPPGLSHAGIPSIPGNPAWINPLLQQSMPYANPYAYGYGYRPLIPVGYGLSHAGIGQELAYNHLAQPILGYSALQPLHYPNTIAPHYTGIPVQSPLQPNWSNVPPPQQA